MQPDGDGLWQLLRSLDDPDGFEFPAGYRPDLTRAKLNQLAQRLDAAFGCECYVDRHVQDASLHGRIEIPATAASTGDQLVISVSNFGDLAVLSVTNPGVWDDAEAAELLHPDDRRRVTDALVDVGFTLIPEEPLWREYDGAASFTDSYLRSRYRRPSWWDRYFDWL